MDDTMRIQHDAQGNIHSHPAYAQQYYNPAFGQQSVPMSFNDLDLQYDAQPSYHIDAYGDSWQQPVMAADSVHSHSYHDRNETKPRLAKQEVELLERRFQENHKPSSSLKRQLAANLGVHVGRINNWFQNRRAKAKQEAKEAVKSASTEGEENKDEIDSSEDLPPMLDETNPLGAKQLESKSKVHPHQSTHEEIEDSTVLNSVETDFERPPKQESNPVAEYENRGFAPALQGFNQATFTGSEYEKFDAARFPPSNMSNSNYLPTSTQNLGDFTRELSQASSGYLVSSPEDTHYGMAIGANMLPTLNAPFPSQYLGNSQLPAMPMVGGNAFPAPSMGETTTSGSEMRFMSPPPAADIASRRSKRRPAPIGTQAPRDRAVPNIKTPLTAAPFMKGSKSPSHTVRRVVSVGNSLNVLGGRVTKSVAPPSQSPLRPHFPHELKKFADINSQVNLFQPPGNVAPLTPPSPCTEQGAINDNANQFAPFSNDCENGAQNMAVNGFFQGYDFGMSPPETPGLSNGSSYCWSYEGDGALHTPSFGSFPNDHFQMAMPPTLQIPPYVNSRGDIDSAIVEVNGTPLDAFQMQMQLSEQFASPQPSMASVSPASGYRDTPYVVMESGAKSRKPETQYHWNQEGSDYSSASASMIPSSEQTRNLGLVFQNCTPSDFQGKSSCV